MALASKRGSGSLPCMMTARPRFLLLRTFIAPLFAIALLGAVQALDLTIDKDLSFDGKVVKLPASLAEVQKVLGPPDRVANLANKIHTWDKLGVTVYANGDGTKVEEICIQLAKEPYPFSPKESWAGKVTAFGFGVGTKTDNASFEKAGFKRKSLLEAYNYEKDANGIHVSVDTVDNKLGWTRVSITTTE